MGCGTSNLGSILPGNEPHKAENVVKQEEVQLAVEQFTPISKKEITVKDIMAKFNDLEGKYIDYRYLYFHCTYLKRIYINKSVNKYIYNNYFIPHFNIQYYIFVCWRRNM
jgi:hypothetical protein